ncbi:imidazole glycerol phosphate synthase subunit HisF [Caldibacillus thermolactis]|jgi:imidazole glycerol-phosphate synthase subunit HisF|uniref:Imidazole glycerol phosphate synthase subunit HisF n=2 Tax=Pallidibacillus TaxID=3034002 RepID=A0ABT2WN77_9BACI|nr:MULTISPECIES: imidazole glycerol phosphate synthase subunit HisF [Pallidibacillus]MCU9595427.1 imidazole glycerol phosphate synthase subunit HisF [Pallidibacillus thermolactis]MCU9600276.1 imidazole glycerol phosphate synthase subunit HisF [Pallidibacillus thermolactis subsp. kokeshiiformis]MED1674639.1 imidazole glycerol phosphate synthase subunit HisF [Pallidibacillus thermolactis subsp. kokeshiiformis]NCU16737.1 imidazole glycerol phosphate synthase subunit HisF [Pallidibacillus pasinlere
MLAKRIIPCLDVRNGRVVKGEKFKNIVDIDDPVKLAQKYSELGADELVFYDITASNEDRDIFVDVVEKTAEQVRIPFTVGGGIRSIEDFRKVLKAGADKVSINSAAVKNPTLIKEAAEKFGSQCVVLSIDAKKQESGNWTVFINGGRIDTGMDAVEWALKGEKLGAGEIVLNAIDTDGVKSGYSIDITGEIAKSVNIPVVASGGAGKKEDFLDVFKKANADAALAASVFHYGEVDIQDLKQYLFKNGIEVRGVQ